MQCNFILKYLNNLEKNEIWNLKTSWNHEVRTQGTTKIGIKMRNIYKHIVFRYKLIINTN